MSGLSDELKKQEEEQRRRLVNMFENRNEAILRNENETLRANMAHLWQENDQRKAELAYAQPELAKLRASLATAQTKLIEMTAYADKLADELPMLPKDIEVMRQANAKFAQENFDLEAQLATAQAENGRLKEALVKAHNRANLAEAIVERVLGNRNPYDMTTDQELIRAWNNAKDSHD